MRINTAIDKLKDCSKEQLVGLCSELNQENEHLRHIILNQNRALYGSKSEKSQDTECDQLGLFEKPLNNAISPPVDQDDVVKVVEHERKKKKGKKLKDLPRIIKNIPVPDDQRHCSCGCEKQTIGFEVRERLHFVPAIFQIIEEHREKMACPNKCEQSVVTAPVPLQVLPKVKATEEFLAHITVSKVVDRQPLYHLEKQFNLRYDCEIPRNSMARWMIQMAEKFIPLISLMKDSVLDHDVTWLDATTLQVLNEPDRPAERKSYVYCYIGGEPGKQSILYEYNAKDHKQFLKDTLSDYKGYLHCDADNKFDDLPNSGSVLVHCNAHARRKFEAIATRAKKPGIAKQIMLIYKEIYKIEKECKAFTTENLHAVRQARVRPLMEKMKSILDEHAHLSQHKLDLGNAIKYARSHWEGLTRFLEDGRLDPDNNFCERNIKPFVMARKNFLFADSVAGADALGVHFSLLVTAQHHKLDPFAYYVHLLKQIPYCSSFSDYEKLLPWNVKLNP